MKLSIKRGFSFGLTSGIITTLGLIIGLNSGTHSKIVVIGGILVIAVADALSDSLGMHMSVESENKNSEKSIWESTASTFLTKFIVALTFIIPFLFFSLYTSIILCVLWGLGLITLFSYYLAKKEKIKPYKVILEHLAITILVIIITNFVGKFVSTLS